MNYLSKKAVMAKSLFVAAGLVFVSGASVADTLRIASGVPPKHPAHDPLYTVFAEKLPIASNNALNATILGTEVVALPGMRDGITSGLVDVGLFLPAYFPADLPEINLVGDMAFLGSDNQVMSAAMTEYVVTCAPCQSELKKLGVVFGSSNSTNNYVLLSKEPIVSLADMKGKRVRTGGPQFSRWVEAMGGTPVSTPIGETFEALSQGIIDATVASASDIVSFRLNEVIGSITDINLGTYHSTISHTIRYDTWKKLDREARKALVTVSSEASGLAGQRWLDIANKGLQIAEENQIGVVKPADDLLAATEAFVAEDIVNAASVAQSRNGIENPTEKLDRFKALITKWQAIAQANAHDPAKMARAVEQEVWEQVDFNEYGL